MSKLLEIRIQVPEETPAESIRSAASRGREAAVLALQQEGNLSIREAADRLGLTYEGYLDLLAAHGLPASHDGTDPAVLDLLRERARQIRARPK
jgi:hypothetical protein